MKPAQNGGAGPVLGWIHFQFNPQKLPVSQKTKWSDTSLSKDNPPSEYNGTELRQLSLEMFFDATGSMDDAVVSRVEQLMSCCCPLESGGVKSSPPWVMFIWGKYEGFLAYVDSVNATYTLFTPEGVPIRATCTVALKEVSQPVAKQNPTSGTPYPQRTHVMVAGETLASVAYQSYERADLWRVIARANGIDDPLRIRPGTRLMIPMLRDEDGH